MGISPYHLLSLLPPLPLGNPVMPLAHLGKLDNLPALRRCDWQLEFYLQLLSFVR